MGGGIAANGGVEIGEANPISVSVTKVWKTDDGKTAAESVTVQLVRDGEAYGDPVTLSAENDWAYTWENLEGGYDWSVEETDVPEGFKAEVTSEESKGSIAFTITNDDIHTDTVKVTKEWKLDDGGKAANSVKVQLYKDGEAYGDPVELTATTEWTYTWTELETGHEWTVKEVEVPEGFTSEVTGSVKDGFTITNDDKPEEPKTPETPDTPDTPENPTTPDNPTTPSTPEQPTTPEKKAMPQTGDTFPIAVFMGLVAAGVIAIATSVFVSKRNH